MDRGGEAWKIYRKEEKKIEAKRARDRWKMLESGFQQPQREKRWRMGLREGEAEQLEPSNVQEGEGRRKVDRVRRRWGLARFSIAILDAMQGMTRVKYARRTCCFDFQVFQIFWQWMLGFQRSNRIVTTSGPLNKDTFNV